MLKTTTTPKLAIAIFLVLVSLGMLVKFDEIIEALLEHGVSDVLAKLLPIAVVASQVFSLPYLLGLETSKKILAASKAVLWMLPILWMLLLYIDIV